jgi:ADP-ribose pyrophosphatase YjhB (NUDIX family)
MKRLGVAGLISRDRNSTDLLMGRRDKDPNRGPFVLPGGGVQDGESLEEAFRREIMEETSLELEDYPQRWYRPNLIELPDRIILVVQGKVKGESTPKDGGDLYDVQWFDFLQLPPDISPVVVPILTAWGFLLGKK